MTSYACDYLIDLTKGGSKEGGGVLSLHQATKKLVKHVKKSIKAIQIGRGRNVEQFYIGKTHVRRRKRVKFNHMKSFTWRLAGGINDRFRRHRGKGYGVDGLVVLTVLTRAAIPPNVCQNRTKVKQELYAFALENRLIQHFLIKRDDPRIVNTSLDAGGKDSNSSIGYPLYMAFKLEDEEQESSDMNSCNA